MDFIRENRKTLITDSTQLVYYSDDISGHHHEHENREFWLQGFGGEFWTGKVRRGLLSTELSSDYPTPNLAKRQKKRHETRSTSQPYVGRDLTVTHRMMIVLV